MNTCQHPDGCDRRHHAKGLCKAHWARLRKHGDPGPAEVRVPQPATCTLDGCDRKPHAKGLCQAHWRRFRKHGDPGPTAIPAREPRPSCTLDGCERPVNAHGWCRAHWERILKHGEPGSVEIGTNRPTYRRHQVLAEWGWLIDPELSKAENCRRLAPRMGMHWRALERAIERAKVAA